MRYTKEQILNDHAKHLLDAEYFAEHSSLFNSFSEEEQIKLASEMMTNCPSTYKDLREFGRTIHAVTIPKGTFYSFIAAAHKIKSIIFSCLDERNPRPHDFLLEEFDWTALKQFNSLALDTLAGFEKRIAERFVITTPPKLRHDLMKNADLAFPDSIFVKEINKAFILNHIEELPVFDNGPVSAAHSPNALFNASAKPEEPSESDSEQLYSVTL